VDRTDNGHSLADILEALQSKHIRDGDASENGTWLPDIRLRTLPLRSSPREEISTDREREPVNGSVVRRRTLPVPSI
jgi:hypothetical protein